MTRINQSLHRAMMLAGAPDPVQFEKDNPHLVPKYRRPSKPREDLEGELQEQICDYLNMFPDILYFHPLQNMWRGKNTNEGAFMGYMAKMKRRGHKAGIPDLVLWFRNNHGAHTTLLIELKIGNNQLTDNQREVGEKANNAGCITGLARSIDDVRKLLREAGHVRHQ